MANPEHIAALRKGVDFWNQWQSKHLSFSHTTHLADLTRADLCGKDLTGARFYGTDLSQANLRDTDLRLADFNGAVLAETDFTGANVGATTFCGTDLSSAKGLDKLRHLAPSSIGVDSIYKSGANLPRAFLIGVGIPDVFIDYLPSLLSTGIQFYSLFISYSTKDQDFAERLHADLQARSIRCWFAPHQLQGGKKLHEQIDFAIRTYDKLLLILSPASMQSEWVKTEISKARKREIGEGRRVLFPIRLCSFEVLREWECFDSDTGKDSAREIREYFIPDFSNWKDHDAYKTALDRLLQDFQQAISVVGS